MRTPFTLDKWLADKSQQVETAFGKSAKIVFTDGLGEHPILAVICDGDTTDCAWYSKDGKSSDGINGLFFVAPNPALTAKDLMIGDWVEYDGTYQKVIEIANWSNWDKCIYIRLRENVVGCEDVNPIPLTPEILEKNFKSSDNMFGLQNYELGQGYILEHRGERFCLTRMLPRHKYSTSWICNISCVHQLQNALRLCGIDLEIKL